MKNTKKILAIVLSVLLIISVMPFAAFAEDVPEGTTYSYTSNKGVTTYKTGTLSISSEGTYKLYQDLTVSSRLVPGTFSNSAVIDLNGHTLTSTATDYFAYLNRTGSASSMREFAIINTSETPATVNSVKGIACGTSSGGKFQNITIGENVTVNVSDDAVVIVSSGSVGSNVTINGTVNAANDMAITVNGQMTNTETPVNITVNGEVNGKDAGIYAAGYANYVINGTVTGETAIYQKGGNLVVNEGAVVTATGDKGAYVQNGNGFTPTGDAIVVEDNGSYLLGTTTINGGTISSTAEGTNAVSDYVANNIPAGEERADVDVKGGTFTAAGEPDAEVAQYVDENSELDPATGAVTHFVAEANGTKYESLEDALAAISTVTTEYHSKSGITIKKYLANGTVTLLDDCNGNGFVINSGSDLTIDFNGFTYDVTGDLVGSNGTETQGLQLLKDSDITLENGTLTSSKAKFLIQNYSNLTLDNMNVTLNNPNYAYAYTLSNNNGSTVIKDTTIVANPAGGFAFDVCRYSSYPSVAVTVTGNSVIDGDVEVSASAGDAKDGLTLNLDSGTMTGDIVIDNTVAALIEGEDANTTISKEAAFEKDAPEGYMWNDQGELVEDPTVAVIGEARYNSLEEAVAAAVDGDTVTVIKDCAGNGIQVLPNRFNSEGLVIDFADHTFVMDGETVGSPGTKTQAFQLQMNNKITLKNGTIYSEKAKMLVQNYSDLTLDNMVLTLNNPNYAYAYTLSNNNGDIVIDDTTINANPAGGFAFDVCRYSSYPSVNVTVTGDSVINGNVEISASGSDPKDGFSLTLESGTMTGDLVLDTTAKNVIENNPDKVEIKKDAEFAEDAPEGYIWNDQGELVEDPTVAVIGEARYDSLEAAFAAAVDGDTITLIKDCAGNGIKVAEGKFNNAGLTVDFGGYTYTVNGTTVGSTGTETQGFQLLKNNNITFQNGKIYGDSNVTTSLLFLIQNYSNLTLDNMELVLIGRYYNQYTLSNNNGAIVIDDSVINAPDYSWAGISPSDANSFAFDVCRYASYPSVSVTVKGNSVINGDVEISASNNDAKQGLELNLVSGTMTGDIVLDDSAKIVIEESPETAEVKKAANFSKDAPEGFVWNDEGVLVPKEPENGGSLTLDDGITFNAYLDADAYGVDEDEAIVKVTYNKNSNLNNNVPVTVTETKALSSIEKYVDPTSEFNGTYKLAYAQAPAQMHEDILIELYKNAAAETPEDTLVTSAAKLCQDVIGSETATAEYKDLCAALLDYGRAAQLYFEYDLDHVADSFNNLELPNLSAQDMATTPAAISGIPFKGVSMTVLGTTQWNITTHAAQTVLGISGIEGTSAAATVLKDGNYAIAVSGINAADYTQPFTVETTDGYITLSAAMIARSIVKGSANVDYQNLARAFYFYGVAADAYFPAA